MIRRWISAAACLACCACEGVLPEPDLERMSEQPKYLPYAPCRWFPDGRAMRPPPAGTIPHDGPTFSTAVATGRAAGVTAGRDLDRVPIPVDRELLERGRARFDIHCAACHGPRGDGRSPVALAMDLRRPPSLIDPPLSDLPPGRLFRVAGEGYGLMPGYAGQLDVVERWAIVAYLGALSLSQSAPLDRLPPAERARALEALR